MVCCDPVADVERDALAVVAAALCGGFDGAQAVAGCCHPAFVVTAMHNLLVGEHDTDAALWVARRQAQLLADLAGS